jgi:energy-coupling factor transport system ATP-binding protein
MIRSLTMGKHKDRIKRVGPNDVFMFSPGLNMLVGPNGSGKSTVLRTLAGFEKPTGDKRRWETVGNFYGIDPAEGGATIDANPETVIRYFDGYRMNAAVQGAFGMPGIRTSETMEGMRKSHGQGGTMQLERFITEAYESETEDGTVLIDEPECGLDFARATLVMNGIKNMAGRRQVIVVTHDIGAALALPDVRVFSFGPEADYPAFVGSMLKKRLCGLPDLSDEEYLETFQRLTKRN